MVSIVMMDFFLLLGGRLESGETVLMNVVSMANRRGCYDVWQTTMAMTWPWTWHTVTTVRSHSTSVPVTKASPVPQTGRWENGLR